MFKSRAALAATLSGTYGIYNGFELLEHEPIPGSEEYLDSEKYEIKVRDWDKPGNIKPYISDLNHARRHNPALQQTGNLRFLGIEDGNVIGFVKESVTSRTPSPAQSRCRAMCTISGCRSATSRSAWPTTPPCRGGREPDHGRALRRSNGAAFACGSIRCAIPPSAVSLPGVRGSAMNVLSSDRSQRTAGHACRRRALVQGRHHLSASRQGLRRQQQ